MVIVPISIVLVLAELALSSSSSALGQCGRTRWHCAGGDRAGAGSAGLFVVLISAGVVWSSYLLALVAIALVLAALGWHSGVRAGGIASSSIVQQWLVIKFHVLGYSPIMCIAARYQCREF